MSATIGQADSFSSARTFSGYLKGSLLAQPTSLTMPSALHLQHKANSDLPGESSAVPLLSTSDTGLTAGAAKGTGNGTRVKKMTHRERQKQQVQQLEQQREKIQQQLDALTHDNQLLRHRSDVLAGLVHCIDEVEEVLVSLATPTPAGGCPKVTQEELAQLSACCALYEGMVTKLSRELMEAEMDECDQGKQDAVAAAVNAIWEYTTVVCPLDPERTALLLAMHLTEAYKNLKVPEEQQWLQVVQSLQLTQEQRIRALLTRDLFLSTYTSMPRSADNPDMFSIASNPSPVTPPPHTLPSFSNPASRQTHPSRHPDRSTNLTTQVPHRHTQTTSYQTHPIPSSNLPFTTDPRASTTCPSSPHIHTFPIHPLIRQTFGPASHVDQAALDRLEQCCVNFSQWCCILERYIFTRLLTPVQAARAFVRAFPLYPNSFSMLNAIAAASFPSDGLGSVP